MKPVIYADFTDPYGHLASRRVDALAAAGVEVDWRAVEFDPRLPVTGRRPTPSDEVALKEKLAAAAETLLPGEDMPSQPPGMVPKTEAAVSAYAEAYGAGVAADVRRLLFDAYWLDGADIGDPNVLRPLLVGPILRGRTASEPLRQSGYCVSVNRAPITTGAYRRIRAWRDEWARLGTGASLTLVLGGRLLTGAEVTRWLAAEMTRLGVAGGTDGRPDPGRYPLPDVHPSASWASMVGGPWKYLLRTP